MEIVVFVLLIRSTCYFYFKNYMDYLLRLYEREIKDFFEVVKIKMIGIIKESKKFGKFRYLVYCFLFY